MKIPKSEQLKGNRIIAEFMSKSFASSHITDYKNAPDDKLPKMKYHTSWDWLMPVIAKISKIKVIDAETYQDTFYPRTFGMLNKEGQFMVRFNCSALFFSDDLILAAYYAVIDFIEWYNQQPKV